MKRARAAFARLFVAGGVPGACLALLLEVACKNNAASDAPPATTSPQATAVPAPVTSVPGAVGAAAVVGSLTDGGVPPSALRGDLPAPPDRFPRDPKERDTPRETRDARETKDTAAGYTLSFLVRSTEPPPAHRAPEVSAPVVDAARRKTEEHLTVDLGVAHMRALLEGAFLFPSGTELRARLDKLGYVVLLPPGTRYRVLGPGALRTWLSEGRYDAMRPLDVVTKPLSGAATRLGVPTRSVEMQTESARMTLEIGKVQDAYDSGVLLCRFLTEIIDAPAFLAPCGQDEVPLRAEIHFLKASEGMPGSSTTNVASYGGLVFEAQKLARRTDLSFSSLSAPPSTANFAPEDLSPAASRLLIPAGELTDLQAPVDVPLAPDAPLSGLVVQNGTLQMQRIFLDGVPCAQVAPYERLTIVGLARGRYMTEVRTPLDARTRPPQPVVVPGKLVLGSADAGVR
ncbi:MAG: hypothetical protein U0174_18875 [Polyangiaceae bacterium]